MKKVRLALVVSFLLLSQFAGSGKQMVETEPVNLRCPKTVKITIKNFKYNEGNPVTIDAGDSVIWFNADDMPHTATSTEASAQSFDTGILAPGAASEPIVFLQTSGDAGFPYSCGIHPRMSGTVIVSEPAKMNEADMEECHNHETPSEHSMVVTGLDPESIFLHHISLFGDTNHFYHVTLEAKLEEAAAREAYRKYRNTHADSLCILDPELFLLPEIQTGKRVSFQATFNHGKWESKIDGLQGVKVRITRIIQFRRYDPKATYPDRLTYQLYGNSKEAFLAHQVTAAPSFQQLIKLKEVPTFLTADIIKNNPLLIIPTKQLAESRSQVLRTAVLNNGTHILLSPPVGALRPTEPLTENEEIEVQISGEKQTRKLVIGKLIYFDVRILNK
jgi:plastocyanin